MKRFIEKMKRDDGFAIVETLVASALLGISAYFIINSSGLWGQKMKAIQTKGSEVVISDIVIQSALANGRSLQVDYSSYTAKEILDDLLTSDELPMAWNSEGKILPAESCKGCPGRYGVVVKPVPQYRGLYQVVIRMAEKKADGKYSFQDYVAVISK